MRVQYLFVIACTLCISKIYVSASPTIDNGASHVTYLHKRARCTKMDLENGKCDHHGYTMNEQAGLEKRREEKTREKRERENNNEKDRQAADDGSGSDRASRKKDARKGIS